MGINYKHSIWFEVRGLKFEVDIEAQTLNFKQLSFYLSKQSSTLLSLFHSQLYKLFHIKRRLGKHDMVDRKIYLPLYKNDPRVFPIQGVLHFVQQVLILLHLKRKLFV